MKEFFKLTKIKIVLAVIFLVAIYFVVNFNNFIFFTEKFDPFYTSEEHRKNLGIEIIKLPFEEERKLHSMIEQTIKAGFQYYNTGNEKEFEKVKDLFLIGEYERIKKEIEKTHNNEKEYLEKSPYPCIVPINIPKGEFSQPRKYKSLENRIGIMSLFDVESPGFLYGGCRGDQFHIFVFKQIDNEQKIEKMGNVGIGWPVAETTEGNAINKLLEEIKEDSKK